MAKKMKFGADPREEGVTGGPRTTPMSPTRKETLKKAEEENARNRRGAPPVEKKAKGGKVSNFGKAFRAARAAGKKEFTFGGKSYNTKLKEDAPEAKPKAAEPTKAPTKTSAKAPDRAATKPSQASIVRSNIGKPSNTASDMDKFSAAQEKRMADVASRGRGSARGSGTVGTSNIKLGKSGRQMLENLGFKKGGKTAKGKTMKYAKGGLTAGHKSADGIAKKGKTKGMMPKMAKGGMTKKGCK